MFSPPMSDYERTITEIVRYARPHLPHNALFGELLRELSAVLGNEPLPPGAAVRLGEAIAAMRVRGNDAARLCASSLEGQFGWRLRGDSPLDVQEFARVLEWLRFGRGRRPASAWIDGLGDSVKAEAVRFALASVRSGGPDAYQRLTAFLKEAGLVRASVRPLIDEVRGTHPVFAEAAVPVLGAIGLGIGAVTRALRHAARSQNRRLRELAEHALAGRFAGAGR
jgi:hypothetical protein